MYLKVYGFNKERFSADGFYAIPNSELAQSYILAAFGNANIATEFAISATTATSVQIVLPSVGKLSDPIWLASVLWVK